MNRRKNIIGTFGPLPISQASNRYILVLVDCFTKWTEAYAIPNQESQTSVQVIVNEFICRFGTRLRIQTHQGTDFTLILFKEVCDLLHIDRIQTSIMRPQQMAPLNDL